MRSSCSGTMLRAENGSNWAPSKRDNLDGVATHRYPSGVWARLVTELFGSPSSSCHVRTDHGDSAGRMVVGIKKMSAMKSGKNALITGRGIGCTLTSIQKDGK